LRGVLRGAGFRHDGEHTLRARGHEQRSGTPSFFFSSNFPSLFSSQLLFIDTSPFDSVLVDWERGESSGKEKKIDEQNNQTTDSFSSLFSFSVGASTKSKKNNRRA